MQVFAAVESIMMLFLLAGLGLLVRRIGLMPDGVLGGINRLVLAVAQPALMIASTQRAHDPEVVSGFLLAVCISFVTLAVALYAMYTASRRAHPDARPVMAIASVMPNVGYMGIPIVQAVYGDVGVLYLSGFIVGFNLAQWTIGVSMFPSVKTPPFRRLLNPVFLAALLGAAMFALGIELPTVLRSTVSQVSALNTPLAMMILGARLEMLRPRHLIDGRMWICVVVKLVALPLLLLPILKLLGMSGVLLGAMILAVAMPSGSNVQMLVERFHGDRTLAVSCVLVSTLLSIATVPLILLLL